MEGGELSPARKAAIAAGALLALYDIFALSYRVRVSAGRQP